MPNTQRDKTGTGGHPYRSRSWSGTARRWLAAVTVLLTALGLVVGAGTAAMATTSAASSACTRTVTGVHHGALKASSGRLCLNQATQDGAVAVSGSASVQISAATIKGALSVSGKGSVLVCASTLTGAVSVDWVARAVTFGGGSCGDNTGDTGYRPADHLRVGRPGAGHRAAPEGCGQADRQQRRGHRDWRLDHRVRLACSANHPAPTDSGKSNTVSGKATGQCASLSGGGGLGAPTPPLKQEPPISQDQSGTLPNLNYGEAIGDFTGAGHDERAYAHEGALKIANVDKFGGNVLQSVGTDLMATPNDGLDGLFSGYIQRVSVWQRDEENYAGSSLQPDRSEGGRGQLEHLHGRGHLGTATTTARLPPTGLHLYELPHNGSCASASCAERKIDLPGIVHI